MLKQLKVEGCEKAKKDIFIIFHFKEKLNLFYLHIKDERTLFHCKVTDYYYFLKSFSSKDTFIFKNYF